MNYPKVSIVTPSYNQGKYLEQTILSVLNQEYPNLEYIIIDGGSTDNSVDIIKKYEKLLAYWVSEPDKGQSNAINKGFRIASGDIVNWLNSDDYLLPGVIKRVVEEFRVNLKYDFIYGDHLFIDEGGSPITLVRNIDFDFKIMLYSGNYICQPAGFFRKNLLVRCGYLDESFQVSMDSEIYTRFGSMGCRFKHIPVPIAALRWHRSAKTMRRTSEINQMRDIIRRNYGGYSLRGGGFIKSIFATALISYYRSKRYVLAARVARRLIFPVRLRIHLFNRGLTWHSSHRPPAKPEA